MEADAHFRAMFNISFGVPSKGALPQGISLHGDPVGETGGCSFAWIFLREREKYVRVPFLDPEDTKILSLGAIWNFSKGTGPCELISYCGAQRPCL
jgi:hypothetical protein